MVSSPKKSIATGYEFIWKIERKAFAMHVSLFSRPPNNPLITMHSAAAVAALFWARTLI